MSKIIEKYTKKAEEQKWPGAYTNKQRQVREFPPTANQILKKWKNIPDIVYSVNKTIRQQLLPKKTYQQSKAQMTITDTNCRMCRTAILLHYPDRPDTLHRQARQDAKADLPLLTG